MFEGDAEILQDFLTESGELLDAFDADLVSLETAPTDQEMLNKVFRALHTIKGSASFLSLKPLVSVAHAAEEALNAARRGDFMIDRPAMDLLLQGADVIRRQMDELRSGAALSEAPAELVRALNALGSGRGATSAAASATAPAGTKPAQACAEAEAFETTVETPTATGPTEHALGLPPHKSDLVTFMVEDLSDGLLPRLKLCVAGISTGSKRGESLADLGDLAGELARTVEFFECASMAEIVGMFEVAAQRGGDLDEATITQLVPRLAAAARVLEMQTEGLSRGLVRVWPTHTLAARVGGLVLGHDLEPEAELPNGADVETVFEVDGVLNGAPAQPRKSSSVDHGASTEKSTTSSEPGTGRAATQTAGRSGATAGAGEPAGGAATIRVDVDRLEALLDLVGELVLQKNRVGALARRVVMLDAVETSLRERLQHSTDELDRITGDLQLAVMRTRMQPLDKVFGRYPRLIRDLERATGKSLRLEIAGGDTEVDRTVIELIGDPLVHLLRNSADHGIEKPEQRAAAGKNETGTIRLSASAEGEHVVIEVSDDGAGLNRERILKRAVERGLTSADAAAAMTDSDVFRFIFAPGFSTAEAVSDLSGRGVGMDVVNTNIQKMKGAISLRSEAGKGTTVSISIPLTLAILDAMVIGVGAEEYAIPLSTVVEIVKPSASQLSSIRDKPVMRLRDTVLPLIDGASAFRVPEDRRTEQPFAVILGLNGKQAGLMVSRLVGQREIVVKSLEETVQHKGPISGVTVGEDGEASLIVDVARLLEQATAA